MSELPKTPYTTNNHIPAWVRTWADEEGWRILAAAIFAGGRMQPEPDLAWVSEETRAYLARVARSGTSAGRRGGRWICRLEQ